MIITNDLQAMADSWSATLGGKLPVSIRMTVNAGSSDDRRVFYTAIIGEIGVAYWSAWALTLEQAIADVERQWKLDGSPVDIQDCERAKLRAKAAELGMTVN